jgi:3-isopropylmalate/(R)-2-methylmalate dehydratase small subunit
MEKFERLTSIAAPLLRANVDTDAIIPSREMKSASKVGLGAGLFAGWRYKGVGTREPEPGFVLNQDGYREARILLSGENFGCGSSREHAVWALLDYGFRAVIAPSFSPIFYNNCTRNGIVPVRLAETIIRELASKVAADPLHHQVTVDLPAQQVIAHDGERYAFEIDPYVKEMLLSGLDEIDLTLTKRDDIEAFWQADRERRPWIYFSADGGVAEKT